MIVLILIDIILIILVYLRYYNYPREVYTDKKNIEDYDAIVIGYINDKGISNNCDLILAEIIDLNIKGYITIEYSKDNLNKSNYIIKQNIDEKTAGINEYDMLTMNFLFNNNFEISKQELEEKLQNSFNLYNIQYNELQKVLDKKLSEQNLIDLKRQEEIKKNIKRFIKLSFILIIITCILMLAKVINFSLLNIMLYLLEKITLLIMLYKASAYTQEGLALKYNIDGYKIETQNEQFLTGKNTMEEIVLRKDFARSLALHIKTEAKSTFVEDVITKNAIKNSKKIGLIVLGISSIILIITIIISYLLTLLPKGVIIWLYIIFAIVIAAMADIVVTKEYKRK